MRIAGLVRKQEQSTAASGRSAERDGARHRDEPRRDLRRDPPAARSIAGETAVIRVLVSEEGEDYTVVAAAGGREDVVGVTVPSRSCRSGSATVSRRIVPSRWPCRVRDRRAARVPTESAFLLSAPLFMKDELQGSSSWEQLRASEGEPGHPRGTDLPGGAGAGQRLPHGRPVPPADRSAIPLSRPELHGRRHGRRCRLDGPLREPVRPGRLRLRPGGARGHAAHPADPRGQDEGAPVPHASGRDGGTSTGLIESRMRHRDDFWLHIETLHRPDARPEREGHRPQLEGRVRAQGVRGTALPSGLPRLDHRARQPCAVPGPGRARAGAVDA